MDGQHFDDLARELARGISRRQVLKGLAGGVTGGALAALGIERRITRAADGSCLAGAGTGQCTQDSDCCAPALCNTSSGYCYCDAADSPGIACACATNGDCGLDTLECCGGVCVRAGACAPPRQCGDVGDACMADGDCCEGEVCGGDRTCAPKATCGGDGAACSQDGDCCSGHCGDDQTCAAATPPAGDDPGGTDDCASSPGGCTPAAGGSGDPTTGKPPTGTTTAPAAVVTLPKTGSGATAAKATSAWLKPLGVLGADAALIGIRRRHRGAKIAD